MVDFQEDLAFSESSELEPFLQKVYHYFFPDLILAVRLSGDTLGQRLGHDRLVYLPTGRTVLIDEKLDCTPHPNFALEFVANDRANDALHRVGWVEKPLQINYILYIYLDMPRRAYLLPWDLLRLAWINNKEKWINLYGTRLIHNPKGYYNSVICPVPRREVLQAITGRMDA